MKGQDRISGGDITSGRSFEHARALLKKNQKKKNRGHSNLSITFGHQSVFTLVLSIQETGSTSTVYTTGITTDSTSDDSFLSLNEYDSLVHIALD